MADCLLCDQTHQRGAPECPAQRIGEVVAGKYRLDRILGIGGMGAVYDATHLKLRRKVALKMVHPTLTDDKELAVRFVREAREQANLRHPGIVTIHDADQTKDGTCWMEMERLKGVSLYEHIRAGDAPFPVDRAVLLTIAILDVLRVVHNADLVHRDIKSMNVFIATDGEREQVKILDFGFAKKQSSQGQTLTRPGQILGTALYMPPEQASDARDADERADTYAVGVILFEALTRRWPIRGKTPAEIRAKMLTGAIDRHPREIRRGHPRMARFHHRQGARVRPRRPLSDR